MICPNCGAEYDDRLEKCPYCQAENREAARKKYDEELDSFRKREQEIQTVVPGRTRKTVRKGLITAFLILVIVLALGSLLAGIIGRYQKEKEGERQLLLEQQALEELEQLYQSENYEALYDCVRKYEKEAGYSYVYQKYTQIYFVNESYRYVKEYEDCLETGEGLYTGRLALALSSCGEVLNDAEKYSSDSAILGNEEALERFCSRCEAFLEKLQVTREEREQICESVSDPDGYEKLCQLASRLEERNHIKVEE